MKRKCKRKMNQLRGKAGFPASRKADNIKPLQDTPVSVLFESKDPKGGREETGEGHRIQHQSGRDGRDGTIKTTAKHKSLGGRRLWQGGLPSV